MILRSVAASVVFVACMMGETQVITVTQKLQIPGAVLKPGDYTFSVEDRLQDRAIVRITAADRNKAYLVLSVPSTNLSGGEKDGLVYFSSNKDDKHALRGWMCPGCSTGLEFVYPKPEAAKLTDKSAESVLAVDPEYDKLPADLSPDDMKVVTLWLLSPERITADNKGKGVKAVKYAGEQTAAVSTTQTASVPMTPRDRGVRMPHTASNTYSFAFWGLLLLLASVALHYTRRRRA
ncbi:MAG: LPXTG cell wall anchor domain-containing protein [Bryobacteraceae bacterium]